MRNILLGYFLLCSILLFGQHENSLYELKVIDILSLKPIEGVAVINNTNNQMIGKSDSKGLISFKPIKGEIQVSFNHPMYEKFTTQLPLTDGGTIIRLSENVASIDEVVVSASKFEEKRKDVSQKIQVIRASELENMNQTSTADVLANSGNVMVQKSQLGGGSPVIRGFETNKVLIVVDGIRMNNAIYRGGHLQNVITLDNAIFDRAEIVYGPGSVVYGSDALGGVLSFRTKDPLLSSDGKLMIKANAYTRYMSAANVYAAHADVAVGSKKFGSLTSFTYSNFGDLRQGSNREIFAGNFGARSWYQDRIGGKDSMIMNADSNLQVGSGYTQYDLLQKFMYQQNENVKHMVNLQYSTSSNIPRYDRLTQMSSGLPRFAEWYYGPQDRLLAAYTLVLTNKNKLYDNARLILGYQQIEESRIDRRFNNTGLNHRIENLDIYTLNLDLAKKSGKNELRYGFEGWYNNVASTAFKKDIETGVESPLDTRYASGGANMSSFAAYLTHTYEVNDRLILNEGIRFSSIGLNAKFTDTTFFKFPFNETSQQNAALNGNIGLIYMPDAETRINMLFSTGFRAPNVDDLSKVFESSPGNIIVPNENIKPEYTYNGELGIGHRLGKKVDVLATGYYTFLTNALTIKNDQFNDQDSILYDGVMSNVVSMQNASRAYLYGLELSMNGKISNYVKVYATYNYTYGRIINDSLAAIPLDHIPPVFGKLGFQVIDGKLRGEMFVNYSGWKRIEDYNPFGEDNQAFALPQGMPSWYTINARVGYQFNKNLGIQLACENILDRNYRVFASNISAPGRNFIFTLRGSF